MSLSPSITTSLFALAVVVGAAGAGFAAEGEPEENPGWEGNVAISANAQTGTTDSFSGSLDAEAQRTFNEKKDEVKARFNATYGTTRKRNDDKNDEVTADSQILTLLHKRIITPLVYWGSNASAGRDTTQDLEVRATIDTGPGLRVWHREPVDKTHFDINFGPGYRYELYDGNTGGTVDENGDADHYIDLVAGFEYKNQLFGDRVDFIHTGSARVPMNNLDAYLLRSEIIFGLPITSAWSFRTAFLVEYTAEPGSDEVNNTLTRTTLGLDYKF
jgi:putative salt-induced outer membrane protein YdiY